MRGDRRWARESYSPMPMRFLFWSKRDKGLLAGMLLSKYGNFLPCSNCATLSAGNWALGRCQIIDSTVFKPFLRLSVDNFSSFMEPDSWNLPILVRRSCDTYEPVFKAVPRSRASARMYVPVLQRMCNFNSG